MKDGEGENINNGPTHVMSLRISSQNLTSKRTVVQGRGKGKSRECDSVMNSMHAWQMESGAKFSRMFVMESEKS